MQILISQGWECPKCKRVYSPTTNMCQFCPTQTTTSTSISFGSTGTSSVTIKNHNFITLEGDATSTKCYICGLEKWQHPHISFT